MNKYLCGNKLLMYVCICVWKGCLLVTWKDERYTDFMYTHQGVHCTISENSIGAPKIRKDYDVIQLLIFQQFWKQYWTFYCYILSCCSFSSLLHDLVYFFASILYCFLSIVNALPIIAIAIFVALSCSEMIAKNFLQLLAIAFKSKNEQNFGRGITIRKQNKKEAIN